MFTKSLLVKQTGDDIIRDVEQALIELEDTYGLTGKCVKATKIDLIEHLKHNRVIC